MLSPPNFADLLKSNEPPSDPIFQEVSELCAIARNDLLQVDAEIQRLQEKRAAIQKSIDSYTIVLSPIRRLPIDILQEIFYHCLHSTRNPIMSAREAPMLLTRVCGLWRSIALASPSLWAAIHIPHPGDPQISPKYEHFTENAGEDLHKIVSEVMERRCQVVKEWLERSGSCLLSLSISYSPYDIFGGYSPERSESDIFMDEIFQILVPFIQRWRSLDLSMPFSVYQQLEAKIPSKSMLCNLQVLRMAVNPTEPSSDANVAPPLLVVQAPNLRMLSVNAFRLTLSAPTFLPTNVTSLLTDLYFDSQVFDSDIVILLQACPRLVNCQIQVARSDPSPQAAVGVRLPHLLKLIIFEFSYPPSPFLRSIEAPSLTFFQYQNPEQHYRGSLIWQPHPGTDATVKCFMGNSLSNLKTLAINPSSFRREVLPLLQFAVGVTHLHIGWFPCAQVFEQSEPQGDPYNQAFRWAAVDLSVLRIRNDLETNDLGEPPNYHGDEPILHRSGIPFPNLEVLEVDKICAFREDNLMELFTSRIDASTRGDASPLKRVELHFSSREVKPIMEEVQAYARSAGIEIEFELSYPPLVIPPTPHYIHHLSPSFLLPDPLSLNPFQTFTAGSH